MTLRMAIPGGSSHRETRAAPYRAMPSHAAPCPAVSEHDHSNHTLFERVVVAAIMANTVVLITSFADIVEDGILEPIHVSFLFFFLGELLVRLHRTHWDLREFVTGVGGRWNAFDTIIVIVSLLPLFITGMDGSLLRIARLARVTHSVRHVGHLRLARFFPARIFRWKRSK